MVHVSEEDGLGTSGSFFFFFNPSPFPYFFLRDMTETLSGQICNHFYESLCLVDPIGGMLFTALVLTLIVGRER